MHHTGGQVKPLTGRMSCLVEEARPIAMWSCVVSPKTTSAEECGRAKACTVSQAATTQGKPSPPFCVSCQVRRVSCGPAAGCEIPVSSSLEHLPPRAVLSGARRYVYHRVLFDSLPHSGCAKQGCLALTLYYFWPGATLYTLPGLSTTQRPAGSTVLSLGWPRSAPSRPSSMRGKWGGVRHGRVT